MKAAEVFFVVAIFVACLIAALWAIRALWRTWRASRHEHEPWHIEEHSDGELVEVTAVSGDEQLLIGAAPFAADDFDSRLYGLRAEGRAKVYTLNEGRR